MSDLEQFRKDKNDLFSHQPESPLTSQQKEVFKGLKYYSPNSGLIFRNLAIMKPEGEKTVQIKTSAGDTEPYKILGFISFEINDVSCHLTIYKSVTNSNLFLPFRDQTNQVETYHDGRYIEIEVENLPNGSQVVKELDFNYAYNPYCAYNDRWRCPLTPEENTLSVEIAAGEKRYR